MSSSFLLRDPGSEIWNQGWKNIRIRDPGYPFRNPNTARKEIWVTYMFSYQDMTYFDDQSTKNLLLDILKWLSETGKSENPNKNILLSGKIEDDFHR